MATANPIPETTPPSARSGAGLLILLAAMSAEELEGILALLTESFPGENLVIATPDGLSPEAYPGLRIVPLPQAKPYWTLTAADFLSAYQLVEEHETRAILFLGPETGSLGTRALQELAGAALINSADLVVPRYSLPPRAGLVNSAILYPLTRALFASRTRFPLAIDLGMSRRMVERMAAAAQRFPTPSESLLWPVNEAALAGFTIEELAVGQRVFPQPAEPDINTILAQVTGSLFADVDAKAAFWQRTRPLAPRNGAPQTPAAAPPADIGPMLEAFRLAYTNLQEIWSLVLPPNSLLGLKRLSLTDAAAFRMPDNLWARIVFDFLLAYRLRTINRGHLLGALIPLYLAWVASHVNVTAGGVDPERHIEAVASAFEADKPYIVARWRWPDRFNP